MNTTTQTYGIAGQFAPDFDIPQWIDAKGELSPPIKLEDYEGKFKVIYCFQAWCPGCHSIGLPSLQKMTNALKDNPNIVFLAVQTVFEGSHENTFEKIKEIQKSYALSIPFGHDIGSLESNNISNIMYKYRTGGTPWFILIDQNNRVVFNDFHLDTDKAIEYLNTI
ncbi:MAG: redoxin domain-containing protein [Saprospiraceae bacterium]|nr:redoxin domain-containing protein [Saprospiraceae bacterium]